MARLERILFKSFVVMTLCSAHPALAEKDLASLLPKKGGEIDVVTPLIPPDVAGAMEKMSASLQQHPEWVKDQAKGQSAGPVPYHKNMGISRAEYDKAVDAFRRMQFRKEMSAKIAVERKGSTLRITSKDPALGPVFGHADGLTFDINEKTVRLPGREPLSTPGYEDGRNYLKNIGRWVPGYTWKAPGVSITVGTIEREPGKCLLNMLASGGKMFSFAMLRYPCGAR